ncbi:hypothetical protein QQS45_05240 [Alteriqipengyuania flavescens]|uniref:hypothetical protein n=1 Tax=Alteriqipengyuania flavescens TaxID=3053610 RepID=UPI0025B404FC|nr:hypothetical protein [Alteriqipengyuania flavescens]WJY19627.1 hypothetical protein QQW98_05235 [Alteriqipengyuania flavescens]WJY25567.1 hypothetical protein QQS45_05240 [Alteriqipengyuania flavescens]
MGVMANGSLAIAEWREFASFSGAEQAYIERALDIGLARRDAFRDPMGKDATATRRHYIAYQQLKALRGTIPAAYSLDELDCFMAELIGLARFDLSCGAIQSFSAFRFLYERLLGAAVRPWLPAAFCAAAALPQIDPPRRKDLLQSLSEAAATAPGWSETEPQFFPEQVELDAA